MKNPLISVIVPCYNQALYIDECLQSVYDQTYPNWECIIVNDGSSDNTEEIAKEWVRKDSRFEYVYKENGGLSSARNAGLDISKGEFVYFLDSDDCVDNKVLEILFTSLTSTNSDISICSYLNFINDYDRDIDVGSVSKEVFNRDELLLRINQDDCLPFVVSWGKLINSKIFSTLRFKEGILHEDEEIIHKIYFEVEKAVFIDLPLCKYRVNENSITHNFTQRNFNDVIEIFDNRYYDYKSLKLSNNHLQSVLYRKWDYVYNILCYDLNIARNYTKRNLTSFWIYCTRSSKLKFKEILRIFFKY